ncbi:helix-turn-helix domain-containing protein [Salibacterium aidingense]|uniref:helix-turn-helix domain-containing protein n=1 Tax=Salibacterium aidingense TaxID=384933 RepID=UPI0003F6BDF9|nr:AraC family transcriptional regulator [Salibacterium aidingense]
MGIQHSEIDDVITYIHAHLDEPLELSWLASQAAYSPYHFARIFKSRTGLPPLYYVSSLRLQKAKELLLRTDLNIRDIGMEIGQQSLGTFTTRFTNKVGLSPSQFRQYGPQAGTHFSSLRQLNNWSRAPRFSQTDTSVEGTIKAASSLHGVILIGLFPKPIPEGLPPHGTLIPSLGDFCISGVTPGIYYLMATAISWKTSTIDYLLPHTTLRTRSKQPIVVEPFTAIAPQHLELHPPRLEDPPILISLPLLMNQFLQRVEQQLSNP